MSESRTDASLGKFKEWFRGAQCWEIQRLSSAVWWFKFGDAAAVILACPWRIVKDGKIVLARDDDGQKFGLSEPVDAEAEALRLIGGNPVTDVEIEQQTSGSSWLMGWSLRPSIIRLVTRRGRPGSIRTPRPSRSLRLGAVVSPSGSYQEGPTNDPPRPSLHL